MCCFWPEIQAVNCNFIVIAVVRFSLHLRALQLRPLAGAVMCFLCCFHTEVIIIGGIFSVLAIFFSYTFRSGFVANWTYRLTLVRHIDVDRSADHFPRTNPLFSCCTKITATTFTHSICCGGDGREQWHLLLTKQMRAMCVCVRRKEREKSNEMQ